MKYSHVYVACLALVATAVLGGCAEFPHVDHAFGHTYAGMIHGQTFNPLAATIHHGPAPAGGMRLENVLKAHRGAVPHGVSGRLSTGQFQTGGGGGGGGG